jgi:hypothetical protein
MNYISSNESGKIRGFFMKKFVKPFVVLFVAAFVLILTSCPDILDKTGGTIEVINKQSTICTVSVVKGEVPNADTFADILEDGDVLPAGGSKTYKFDEFGVYTVIAAPPIGFYKPVTLLIGETQTVTIK